MIPKQLFFIWFGDNKPPYVDFAVNAFKEVNPDFNVNLIWYTLNDINNNIDKDFYYIDVFNCINYILKNNRYQITINKCKNKNMKFLQILSDILRLELISKYGGIYLDCDTFPNKPFDDELLNRKHFTVYCHNRTHIKNYCKDCFFIGSYGNNFYYDNINALTDNIVWDNNLDKKSEDFFKCKLQYVRNDNLFYINHYWNYTWDPNNCKTEICKYD